MRESIRILHEKAVFIAKSYLSIEAELIELLMKLDKEHGYRDFGAKSLNEYARLRLGLSEDPAGTLCRLAAKCSRVPKLLEGIRSGKLSITNARLICAILTPDNQERWLPAASHLSKQELELALASEFPERAVVERLKPVSDHLWKLQLGFSNEEKEKLVRAQDLESSRLSKAANLRETLVRSLDDYLDRRDPIRKALRARARKEKKTQHPRQKAPSQNGRSKRKPLKAEIRHELALRDEERCCYLYEDGSRCESRRWINRHHLVRVADGGPDSSDNVDTLCFGHHALIHHQQAEAPPSQNGCFGAREENSNLN